MREIATEEIIRRIEYYLDKQHMTKYALIKKSGICSSSLNNIFNRRSCPSLMTLQKIVYNGFEISMGEFFGEKKESDAINLSGEEADLIYSFRNLSKMNKSAAKKIIKSL